ncbi:DUF4124 domain-containing protein [Gallaecimonas pentaromativorans]|uniref:DUF4124 domain-containing protein n=1 Tax=Gallaecimonas pentaromativorans TaxID=584787 RepID=UPI003A943A89
MKQALLILLLAASTAMAAESGKIYTWTDAQGVVHYSDKPHPGAKETNVALSQQYDMPKADPNILKQAPKAAEQTRWSITILSPADEATLRENDGEMSVSVQTQPAMLPGQRVQLFMDGKPLGAARTVSSFVIRDVERGEHSIKVQLIDRSNQIIAESEPHTIYMHRASIFSPSRQPAGGGG